MIILEKMARAICEASCFRQRIGGEPCLNVDLTNGSCRANMTQLSLGGPLQTARAVLESLRALDVGAADAMTRMADELHSGCGPQVESVTELHGRMFTAAIDHILAENDQCDRDRS